MEFSIELFPFGEIAGAPVLGVTMLSAPQGDQLVAQALRNQQPGLRALWIKDAPWGDLDLDTALLKFMGDERCGRLPIMAVRDLEAKAWTNLRIHWIADLSRFLGEPCSLHDLDEKFGALGLYPPVREILLRKPPVSNLKPSLLDEVYAHLSPDGVGTVECPHGDFQYRETALKAVVRCAMPWIVRFEDLCTTATSRSETSQSEPESLPI